jgi:hypothetical protein
MLELTHHWARNNTGVQWTVLRLIVTDLQVSVHDFPSAVWPTCRQSGAPDGSHERANSPVPQYNSFVAYESK